MSITLHLKIGHFAFKCAFDLFRWGLNAYTDPRPGNYSCGLTVGPLSLDFSAP